MTNPTPHGQVPEALIDLIDAYAETRHRCGGIYNARTEAARKAVIEALSGVQALSAAPAIGDDLRDRLVAISKAIADQDDRTSQAMLREILAAPQPAPLTAAAGQRRSDLVPGVMHCAKCKFQLNRITLCVSDGNAYAGNNETEPCPNGCGPLWPVTWEQEARNCWKALEEMHERLHPAPTPPAEQQAQPGAVYAELPQPDSWFHFTAQFWENKLRDFADRTHALRMQAAPKAAPTLPEGWTDCTIEFGNDGPEVVAYGPKRMMNRLAKWLGKYFAQVIADAAPKAAPLQQEWRLVLPGGKHTDEWESARVGDYNRGWNDYRKAAIAALNSVVWPARASGNWVAASTWLRNNYQDYPNITSLCDAMLEAAPQQEAPKAAPGEQNAVSAEWLEQAYREGWAACRDAETIGEEAEDWAFGNSTANSRMIDAQQAAPKQEVQEPHGWLYEWTHSSATGKPDSTYTAFTTDEAHARKHDNCRAIYTAPQPAPAELERLRERIARMGLDVDRAMRGHVNEQSPLGTQRLAAIAALVKPKPAPPSDDVVKDAARYRWLRDTSNADDPSHMIALYIRDEQNDASLSGIDTAIDAALAAQRGNK